MKIQELTKEQLERSRPRIMTNTQSEYTKVKELLKRETNGFARNALEKYLESLKQLKPTNSH